MDGSRHRARELALQALYEISTSGHEAEEVMPRLLEGEEMSLENTSFTRALVTGVVQNKEEIDKNIESFAPAWPIGQMPVVDRNILRLAIFEILFDNNVPVKVAINEAVELAKTFGSENTPKFVNGVLGSVHTLAGR